MNFESFINSIIYCFNATFSGIIGLFNYIIQNNFIKLIIFIAIIYLIIEYLDEIINLILNIFSQKKSISKTKESNKNTDIE